MKILLLIACVLFSALSFGENPEAPAGADAGVQWAVTNYPAVLRFYAHQIRTLTYYNDVWMITINSAKPNTNNVDYIIASAERDLEKGEISEDSARLIGVICAQIKDADNERWEHYNKYKFVKQIDSSTKDGERRLRIKIKQVQNEWNEYATAARAEIENNIQELSRLLNTSPAPADP